MDASKFAGSAGNFVNATTFKDSGLQGKVLTVSAISEKTLQDKAKLIMSFAESDRSFVMNATNAGIAIDNWGADTDKWAGRKLKITLVKVTFQGMRVDSLQIEPE